MIFNNDKISIRQMIAILILDIFGTTLIVLPQKSAILANQNAWLIVALTSIMALFGTVLITTLCQRGNSLNFYEQAKKNWTRPIALIILLIFVLKNILVISYELSIFTSMTSQILLPTRDSVSIYLAVLLVSAYCATQGIEARARLSQILLVLLFVSLIFSLAIVCIDVNFKNVLPIQIHSDEQYLKNALTLIFAFMGLDYLYLLYPYVSEKEKYRKGAVIAVTILGVLMTLITLIAVANYNYITLQEQRWPVLDMISEVNLLGGYFERQDALIMSFWIMGVFSTVTAGLYYSTVLLMDVIPKAKTNWVVTALTAITFILTDIYMGVEVNDKLIVGIIVWLMIFFLFIFPILSLIIMMFKKEDKEL